MPAFVKRCNGEQLRRRDYTLPATTVNAYLEHALPHSNMDDVDVAA
jgi:hypothetical protein